MTSLSRLTDLAELTRLLDAQASGAARTIDPAAMRTALGNRVKGQDSVIDDVVDTIHLQWAKERRARPIANFLFLGPTGTGKTELAKAIAEYLYGDEKHMLRIDCSELAGPEAKHHLIGVPTGYQGASQGGKLTRPMINNPRRVVLFDEVEKAYRDFMDLFLQMMGDGRLTEQGSGEVADFTQAIIILTSNAEAAAIARLQTEMSDPAELANAAKSHLVACGIFRAEMAGRLDRIHVFKPLEGIVVCEIIGLKMVGLAREYGLTLEYVDPQIILEAMQRGAKLAKFGVRALDHEINEMLALGFVMAKKKGGSRVRLSLDADGGLEVVNSAAA
jgi:ATP-dependent Clp protease ATP-binding subunit ClpC